MTRPGESSVALQVGCPIGPDGTVHLNLIVGPISAMLALGPADDAEAIGDAIAAEIRKAAPIARARAAMASAQRGGLVTPDMPGFPFGEFPGAQPVPPLDGPVMLPPGHPDRTD
jgi:hypothetical protein